MPEIANLSASQIGSLMSILNPMLINGAGQDEIMSVLGQFLPLPVSTGNSMFNAPDFNLGGK